MGDERVKHCHHYYDENDEPAILQHDHPMENVRHAIPELPIRFPVYWDHEGWDCGMADDIDGGGGPNRWT